MIYCNLWSFYRLFKHLNLFYIPQLFKLHCNRELELKCCTDNNAERKHYTNPQNISVISLFCHFGLWDFTSYPKSLPQGFCTALAWFGVFFSSPRVGLVKWRRLEFPPNNLPTCLLTFQTGLPCRKKSEVNSTAVQMICIKSSYIKQFCPSI